MAFGLVLLATLIGFGTGVSLLITGSGVLIAILGFYTVSFMVVGGLMLLPTIRNERLDARDHGHQRYSVSVEL